MQFLQTGRQHFYFPDKLTPLHEPGTGATPCPPEPFDLARHSERRETESMIGKPSPPMRPARHPDKAKADQVARWLLEKVAAIRSSNA